MSDSPLLGLPYLAASQAQKHVTHNEALSMLDGLVHLAVASRLLTTPLASPTDGVRYLIAASPTGDWAGHAGEVALRMEGAWAFFTPREGWRLWVADEDVLIIFDGASWSVIGGGGGGLSDGDYGDVIVSGGGTIMTVDMANGPLKFPATQNPSADANTLDDYEEGTFTPAFAAAGSAFSYSHQAGSYTKIGNVVHFVLSIKLNTSANTLSANQLSVTGLPFTSKNAANLWRRFDVAWAGSTASYVSMHAYLGWSSNVLFFDGKTAAATSQGVGLAANAVLHATNGSEIAISGTYLSN